MPFEPRIALITDDTAYGASGQCGTTQESIANSTTQPRRRLQQLLASETPKSVGMIYYGWHDNPNGGHWGIPPGTAVIGTPLLGFYRSDERRVLVQHTEWLLDSGVDWVLFDWTNNIPCVERCNAQPCMCVGRTDLQMVVDSALALVDYQVERKRAGLPYLRHATFIGPGDGTCQNHNNGLAWKLADSVRAFFLDNPARREIAFELAGKPLLLWWLANCDNREFGIPRGQDPVFTHPAFTVVVFDNGISGRRQGILDPPCRDLPTLWKPEWSTEQMLVQGLDWCRTRRWSYIESNSPTFSYAVDDQGAPLAMTVSSGIRSCQGWRSGNVCTSVARRDGRTLAEIMELARRRNPRILIVVDWNSWIKGESENDDLTNSLEPSTTLGTYYIDLLGAEIAKWKCLP